ncbi:HAMP domain-containing histidine kinase [Ancylomarina sp. DW003]|nr:ATP-binding protein [Ancylomarina sp. DW003]MDE5422889.1 HAMP domain-containing histidine kinase [Ancylomarina sp. DW003]
MIKPGLKIGLILSAILVLPSLFFSAYEIGNLNQNEQVIDSIYLSQLESILFSVNQYSNDVLSGWANQLEKEGANLEEILEKNYSIDAICLVDSNNFQLFPKEKIPDDSLKILGNKLDEVYQDNLTKLESLQRYLKSGYQKIEFIDCDIYGKSICAFASLIDSSKVRSVFLLLNTNKFISENLGPKIQGIAQDRFFISAFKKDGNKEIYSNVVHEDEEKNIQQKKDFWLFPDYQLGIQMKGNTVEDLVRKRTRTNVILLLIMDVILLLAAWFVYRNIRQQIRLTQLKSDFISNVSHEIRTPLALINMYSETLEMGRISNEEKKHEYYKVINTEANRLSRMVNNILNFNKIESGRREYHFTKGNLKEEVESLLENYRQHLDKKGFQIDMFLDANLPDIKMDKEAVSEAIINLIDNAMKYSNNIKYIRIETEMKETFACLKITDHGIGIASADLSLVFDKFFRVSSGDLAYKAKGSGIGLSIVKHIMDAHNGKVEVESKLGEGSCFSLCFPIHQIK